MDHADDALPPDRFDRSAPSRSAGMIAAYVSAESWSLPPEGFRLTLIPPRPPNGCKFSGRPQPSSCTELPAAFSPPHFPPEVSRGRSAGNAGLGGGAAEPWRAEVTDDSISQSVRDLSMAWHGFTVTRPRVTPEGVTRTFALQVAAVFSGYRRRSPRFILLLDDEHLSFGFFRQTSQRVLPTVFKNERHGFGKVLAALFRVAPCPFAPGISGQ